MTGGVSIAGIWPEQVWQDAIQHALDDPHHETCGLVVSGAYLPCPNIHPEPTTAFRIEVGLVAKHRASGTLQGVIHSHPDGPACPSKADMQAQASTGVPWGVIVLSEGRYTGHFDFGPQTLSQPLLGRVWRSGVYDCFALVRGYFYQTQGVIIPDIPRDEDWQFKDTAALIEANLHRFTMFRRLDDAEARNPEPGDVLMFALGRGLPNHFAIYEGNNVILHHTCSGRSGGDLSSRRPLSTIQGRIHAAFRYAPRKGTLL